MITNKWKKKLSTKDMSVQDLSGYKSKDNLSSLSHSWIKSLRLNGWILPITKNWILKDLFF